MPNEFEYIQNIIGMYIFMIMATFSFRQKIEVVASINVQFIAKEII